MRALQMRQTHPSQPLPQKCPRHAQALLHRSTSTARPELLAAMRKVAAGAKGALTVLLSFQTDPCRVVVRPAIQTPATHYSAAAKERGADAAPAQEPVRS